MSIYGTIGAKRYWRLVYTNTTDFFVRRFLLYESADGSGLPWTSRTTNFTANSSGGYDLQKAYNTNNEDWATCRYGNAFYYDFPDKITVNSFSLGTNTGHYPITLSVSDDFTNWTTIQVITGQLLQVKPSHYDSVRHVFPIQDQHTQFFLQDFIDCYGSAFIYAALDARNGRGAQWVSCAYDGYSAYPEILGNPGDMSTLELHYSGGASNADPAASLGGALSSVQVLLQKFSVLETHPGISVNRVCLSPITLGHVAYERYDDGGMYLSWEASGAVGPGQVVRAPTRVFLNAGGDPEQGHVVVTVYPRQMNASGRLPVYVENVAGDVFRTILDSEMESGITLYRGVYLYNNSPSRTLQASRLFLKYESLKTDAQLSIGVSEYLTPIANETTAPSGVSFSHPTESAPLWLPAIPAETALGLWLKLEIPVGAFRSSLLDISAISIQGRFT